MIEYVQTNWQGIMLVVTTMVTLAAAITALTPTPKDDNIVKKIRGMLNVIGLNIGNAKSE